MACMITPMASRAVQPMSTATAVQPVDNAVQPSNAVQQSNVVQPSSSSEAESRVQRSDSLTVRPIEQVQQCGAEILTLQIDRSAARVAEPIRVQLRFEAEPGTQVTDADFDQALEAWMVGGLQASADLPVDRSSLRQWQWEWSIESLQTGQRAIPPLVVTYQLPGQQQTQQIRTESVSLEIVSVLKAGDEPTKPRAIKGPAEIAKEVSQPTRGWWSWIVLAGVLFVIGIWRFKTGRRDVDAITKAKEHLAAVETAFRQREISVSDSYEHLADILRALVQNQWGLPVSAASSEELVLCLQQQFQAQEGTVEVIDRFREFLAQGDRVRFGGTEGKRIGSGDDNAADRVFADAHALIEQLGAPPFCDSERVHGPGQVRGPGRGDPPC
ncbi:MAG: hypothetical protein VYA84_05835 [Planctomycetota bacterium]|nr:hypothetical protein [Planctomycetota bacterium]